MADTGRSDHRLPTVRIGLLGLGTVGQAVASLTPKLGPLTFQIDRALVRSARTREVSIPITRDAREILQDPRIDVVVEVAGGREPARSWILEALANGKAVVTANKEVMAYHGAELIARSQEYEGYLGYEASVGGGIPILEALRFHLSNAPIQEIYGVVNGTTNYLLCAMADGLNFHEALAQAQDLGYAEKSDPSADIEGLDAARKLVVLTYLAFGRWIDPDKLSVKGLANWPPHLFKQLAQREMGIRLVAMARRTPDGRIQAQVQPTVLKAGHPLLRLTGVQNGIGIVSAAGTFWMEGPGAGGLATATSIWADVRRSQLSRAGIEEISPASLPVTAQPINLPVLAFAEDPLDHAVGSDPEGIYQFPLWES